MSDLNFRQLERELIQQGRLDEFLWWALDRQIEEGAPQTELRGAEREREGAVAWYKAARFMHEQADKWKARFLASRGGEAVSEEPPAGDVTINKHGNLVVRLTGALPHQRFLWIFPQFSSCGGERDQISFTVAGSEDDARPHTGCVGVSWRMIRRVVLELHRRLSESGMTYISHDDLDRNFRSRMAIWAHQLFERDGEGAE